MDEKEMEKTLERTGFWDGIHKRHKEMKSMDDRMVAKEMMKKHIKDNTPEDRTTVCPFYNEDEDIYYHDLCAVVFPGWGRKHLESKKDDGHNCPCNVMSKSYIRRKSRKFVKKNK